MRTLILPLLIAAAVTAFAADKSDHGVWITGDVFSKDGLLLFRADKPIKGNTTGNVVLIGPTRDGAELMGSVLMRAAERHVKLRFYGVLVPATTLPPGHHDKAPSVQFFVWKMHAPTDPDELPPGEAVHPDPHKPLPGYSVTVPPKK